MKRFHFTLETLLKYRMHLERQAQQETAVARSNVAACEERISAMEMEIRVVLSEVETESGMGIPAHRYQLFSRFISDLEVNLEREMGRLDQLKAELARKQEALRKRSVEKKSIENLKETRKTEYYAEMEKLLQKETDDRVVLQKAREVITG